MSRVVKKRAVSPRLEFLEERSLLSAAGYQPPVSYNNSGPAFPVTGDFDGNGTQDIAFYDGNADSFTVVYHDNQGTPLPTGTVIPYGFHTGGVYSIPLAGDFNADGISDLGIYLPSLDQFSLDLINSQGQSIGQYIFNYGYHTGGVNSVPLVGDFNADGRSDVGVYLPSLDQFSLNFLGAQGQSTGQFIFNYSYHTGGLFSVPLVGDFNGDGRSDVGVYLPSEGKYALNYLGAQGQSIGQEVYTGDATFLGLVPFVADFNGDGTADLGLYVPGTYFSWISVLRRTGG